MNPLHWLDDALSEWNKRGLRRQLQTRHSSQDAIICMQDREHPDEVVKLVNFSSNDYLGIAHSDLSAKVTETLSASGWGSGASPLISGRSTAHAELEESSGPV